MRKGGGGEEREKRHTILMIQGDEEIHVHVCVSKY